MLSEESTNTNFIVFGLTPLGVIPMVITLEMSMLTLHHRWTWLIGI